MHLSIKLFVTANLLVALTGLAQMPPPEPRMNMAGANSSGGTSPHETTSAMIGPNRVTITYGRPFSKAPGSNEIRKIWGGLVPWGEAWRAGSDEATTLITQQRLTIGTYTVQPGIYTLYMVPVETGPSKLAISTNVGKWGIPVDETKDLARVDMVKEPLSLTLNNGTKLTQMDQFTILIVPNADGTGSLKFLWEKTQFSVGLKNAP